MLTDPAPDPAPRDADPALYTARVENTGGTSGRVLVHDAHAVELGTAQLEEGEEITLPTGGPQPSASGFNPEQFLAMAWSTCLGETLRVVLTEHGLDLESSVSVEMGLHRDPAGGFRFVPRALVHIDSLAPDRALELAEAAHARCPVSKLLRGQGAADVELGIRP
ncbi:organic hydroperoxide resistance protein [Brachybacterium avium]|uniref:Organic hydroperoxide resistance protein n=1 Tax=Brachybacterium avium TaxID=2017485 RepID=A0A220UBK1_9MICO|nr:OsmC family protein [Brachybacterium avium]ASK65614.1 organic hydroperoxide resistance protein [Brachybacterium avium]